MLACIGFALAWFLIIAIVEFDALDLVPDFIDWIGRSRKPKQKLVQCDLCNELCDEVGFHPEGKVYRHTLHLMRKHWGQPIIQEPRFKHLKKQRLIKQAALQEHNAKLKNQAEEQKQLEEILNIPVGNEFTDSKQFKAAIQTNINKLENQ